MKPIQFPDDADIPNICDDHVFKAVLTRDSPDSRKALNGLLSAILEREVKVLTVTANEPPANSPTDRQIRYDINVKLSNGELANVEMTKESDPLEVLRMEYYLARLFCGQEIRGKSRDFTNLKNTWQVSILVNSRLYRDKALVHHFEYYDRRNGTVFGGRTAVITLELRKLNQIETKPVRKMTSLERWASFFRFSTDKAKRPLINGILEAEEEIAMAGKVMQRFTKKEQEFFDAISREKYQVDMNAKRRREREKRARDRAKALKEGRTEGLAEGLAEGHAEERKEMARKMKAMGISMKQIAAVSGLSPKQIDSL